MSDLDRVAFFLLKPVARACKEFDLLADGDRVAVAVSGGKDSRVLLDLLLRYGERVPFSYDLVSGPRRRVPFRAAGAAAGGATAPRLPSLRVEPAQGALHRCGRAGVQQAGLWPSRRRHDAAQPDVRRAAGDDVAPP